MSAGHADFDSSRLPWLNDTAQPAVAPAAKPSPARYFLGGVAAALLIAGASYWLGLRSMIDQARPAPEAAISLPGPTYGEPRQMPAAEEPAGAEQPVMPRVILVPQPAPVVIRQTVPVPMSGEDDNAGEAPQAATAEASPSDTGETAAGTADQALAQPQVQPAPAKATPLRLWPADVSEGASGRAVRIGTYSTRLQAKKAWAKLVRVYPGITRLKAVVAPVPSVRNGRTYYRLQFGTTSHAHSAVLCQRMRIVGQSCVVIGAPERGGAAAS